MSAPQQAPGFEFTATSSLQGQLSDYLGQYVVLYFYPKDNTPGCTKESQNFSQLHAAFRQKSAVIFGISKDSLSKHESFKKKHNMPFELIADPDGILCEAFDVTKKKSMFGKHFLGIERSTFLIDPKGYIINTWRKVKVAGHAQAVLDSIDS
jgi:thioredoxin-dependent peroxiredoxin